MILKIDSTWDRSDSEARENSMRYHVLYTRIIKQWEFLKEIKKQLPDKCSTAFIPCCELWWRGQEETVIKPMFPGYIFIKSDIDPGELHRIIVSAGKSLSVYIRELHSGSSVSKRNSNETFEELNNDRLMDLSLEEEEFLDLILQFKDGSNDAVIRMSEGYRDGEKIIVMKGPLKGYEKHITDVNTRQRKAYLDISIKGHVAKAGLYLMGKRYYYPDDKDAPSLLSDGSEVDTKELSKIMMEKKR